MTEFVIRLTWNNIFTWVDLLRICTKATQRKGFNNTASSFSNKSGATNWDGSGGYFFLRPDILLPILAFSFIPTSVSLCALSSFCRENQRVSHMYNCCYQNSDEDNLNNKMLILYHSSRVQGTTCVLLRLSPDWSLRRQVSDTICSPEADKN